MKMRYPIHRPSMSFGAAAAAMIGMAAAVVAVLLLYTSPSMASHTCPGTNIVNINPDDELDLDDVVNADPETRATTFCVHAGDYTIDNTVKLMSGDQIRGEPGQITKVGPATRPAPQVKVTPVDPETTDRDVHELIRASGSNVRVTWLDLSGATGRYDDVTGEPVAGSGTAIGVGGADGTFRARYLRVHNNAGAGIAGMKGKVHDSEFFSNSQDPNFVGFTASAVKGITEFEAARNFVHDEQGNGIWLDLGRDDPTRPNGFWVHHNLVVDNTRAGIRYENSPPGLAPGVHKTAVTALIENNEVYGNSFREPENPRPISVRHSQNAVVRENIFGEATIDGEHYAHNGGNIAVNASDQMRARRTDLWNVDIFNNDLNGERIVVSKKRDVLACGAVPDEVVRCANNTP